MTRTRQLARNARLLAPLATAVQLAERSIGEVGPVAVIDSGSERVAALRAVVGATDVVPGPGDHPAITVGVIDGGPGDRVAREGLIRARDDGRAAVAVILGTRNRRTELERDLLSGYRLEMSNVVHVASLEGPGARAVRRAAVAALGDDAGSVARQVPQLRHEAGRELIESSARKAGFVGVLPTSGADLPLLAVIQVRMVAGLAAMHDRPFGAERALDAAAVVGAGFGLRALGRSAVGLVPGVGWAARGAIAYAGTKALGEAAMLRLAAGEDLLGAGAKGARSRLDRILRRGERA